MLAPAGNFAIAEAAFDHGADAVYVGIGQLNLRAHSPNFSVEDFSELMDMAKSRGKKVYAALNIMPDTERLALVRELLKQIEKGAGIPDAFIISDPGVLVLCREILPQVQLHLSTQTGVFNYEALKFWKEQGIVRAVLPRELSLEQISDLTSRQIMETEAFVHGAMCVSVSGRCLLGAYLGGRHPNLGDCPQPCRFRYRIKPVEEDCRGDSEVGWFDAEETEKGVYLLNSRDLCTIEILPDLIAAGLDSLKIEGRNKSIHYVASVVKIYRTALNSYEEKKEYTIDPQWKMELEKVEHRPYTTGFYKGEAELQEVFSSKASTSSRVIGVVKGLLNGGIPVIDVKNSFNVEDILEVLPVRRAQSSFQITLSELSDLVGNQLLKAPSNRFVLCRGSEKLYPGDMLRKPQIQ